MKQAIQAVKRHRKILDAKSILRHYINRSKVVRLIAKQEQGKESILILALPEKDKNDLAEELKVMKMRRFELSKEEVLDVAKCFVNRKNLKTSFIYDSPGKPEKIEEKQSCCSVETGLETRNE